MRRVYVTAHAGRYVPGLGTRRFGEYFEVSKEQAESLLGLFGFSERKPGGAKGAIEPETNEQRDGAHGG